MTHIASYSPNMRHGKQVIEITLMYLTYKAVHQVTISGNFRGFDAFDAAISELYETMLPEDPHDFSPARTTLTMTDGSELLIIDEEDENEDFIKKYIVEMKVISWSPPTLNALRAMNGAPPLPGGDVPWNPDGLTITTDEPAKEIA